MSAFPFLEGIQRFAHEGRNQCCQRGKALGIHLACQEGWFDQQQFFLNAVDDEPKPARSELSLHTVVDCSGLFVVPHLMETCHLFDRIQPINKQHAI